MSHAQANKAARDWCFTINNWSAADVENLRAFAVEPRVAYCIWQQERGSNGTPHLQGYIEFNQVCRRRFVCRLLGGRAFVEPRNGPRALARAYCTPQKPDPSTIVGPSEEVGRWREQGGDGGSNKKQAQSAAFLSAIRAGLSDEELAEQFPGLFLQRARAVTELRGRLGPGAGGRPVGAPVQVIVFVGGTGTGKTTRVYAECPEVYRPVQAGGKLWWDGYAGEEAVLLDDFRGKSTISDLGYLLQLTQPFPMRVEYKGGSRPLAATTFYITSNTELDGWYPGEDISPLRRRVTHFERMARAPLWNGQQSAAIPRGDGPGESAPIQDGISDEAFAAIDAWIDQQEEAHPSNIFDIPEDFRLPDIIDLSSD